MVMNIFQVEPYLTWKEFDDIRGAPDSKFHYLARYHNIGFKIT